MPRAMEPEPRASGFSQMLSAAAALPGVRIDRVPYLKKAFGRYCTSEELARVLSDGPSAGASAEVIARVAETSIRYEVGKASGLSTLAGMPGGLAMLGTMPADMAQYVGHMLRVAQKLAYVYGWPDLFGDEEDGLDEATEGILTLFLGVMFGVQAAQGGVTKASTLIAAQVVRRLPQKALTKGFLYPIVKRVAGYLGISMTKQIFASGLAKAVPIVGAVFSGGLTFATFGAMSKLLQKHLSSLEVARPQVQPEAE